MNKNVLILGIVASLLLVGIVILVVSKDRSSPKVTPTDQAKQVEHAISETKGVELISNSHAVAAPIQSETLRSVKYELPASILEYLAQPKQRPQMTGLPLIDTAGEDLLIQKYREIDAFTNKPGLIRLMAYTGGDKVFELFAHTLTNELAGRTLTRTDGAIVGNIPQLIGILARKSDQAFEFLKAGMQPAFWKQNATWKTQTGSDLPRILAENCLSGLALSGRKEGGEIINGLRNGTSNPYVREICSGAVDAAFKLDLITQYGIAGFLDNVANGDINVTMKAFETWLKTTNGMAWRSWRQNVERSR